MKKNIFTTLIAILSISIAISQNNTSYWQQHVDYTMDVSVNVKDFTYSGTQKLEYTNNAPEALNKVYYHLFFNAFQPGSEMDARIQNISDPDGRMVKNLGTKKDPIFESRISKLSPSEIGFLKIKSLKQNGKTLKYTTEGTVLEVELATAIQPGEKVTFDMTFDGQVPVQIRRSGRNNAEGVALSMTQWYPKMAEYDFEGWHTSPYIAREFHQVWGNFDVKLTLDKKYTIGGTGYLQNANEIGHGYEDDGVKVKKHKGKTLTWHFKAPNVLDFAWTADPDYVHDKMQVPNGPMLHFLYKNDKEIIENWKKLQPKAVEMMQFFSKSIGEYPWEQYSILQGGDGGMEYAMCTLITGGRNFGSLAGVTSHEMAHTWFQHILASNESKHEWMDEGFTSFISALCMNQVMDQKKDNPFRGSYRGYQYLVKSGKEQPQSTHADRYNENMPYSIAAYSKGAIFLSQLGYVIGQDKLMETLKRYFQDFKFKHPTPNDIKRTAEKVSGLHLDWYLTDWTQTTNTIDYGIKTVTAKGNKTEITLERNGLMPMPIDIVVVYKDGTKESFYAPLRMMRGEKANPYPTISRKVLADWAWAFPTYSFTIDKASNEIETIVIDPSQLMADTNPNNNVYPAPTE